MSCCVSCVLASVTIVTVTIIVDKIITINVVYLSVENPLDQYALNIFQTFEFLLTAPR